MGAPAYPADRHRTDVTARVGSTGSASAADLLRRQIAQAGPITVAEFMATALGHPTAGYYATRDPLGRAGDFTSAPEISQVFGELIGLWCADLWLRAGRPNPVHIVELGPGRGTLMADLWRAVGVVPGLRDAAQIHLVEVSPVLRARQTETLAAAGGPEPHWHDGVTDALHALGTAPILLIANEFLDALPIRQFVRTADGWRERRVAWVGDRFAFGLDPAPTPALGLIPPAIRTAPEPAVPIGAVWEACPGALSVVTSVAQHVATHGLAALFVDYGHAESACGDTLQAVQGHAPADPLGAPGDADLTAHVNFATLHQAIGQTGAGTLGPATQAAFLTRLGLAQRVDRLCAARPNLASDTRAAADRLIDPAPTGMGRLFKVLCAARPGLHPAGFDD